MENFKNDYAEVIDKADEANDVSLDRDKIIRDLDLDASDKDNRHLRNIIWITIREIWDNLNNLNLEWKTDVENDVDREINNTLVELFETIQKFKNNDINDTKEFLTELRTLESKSGDISHLILFCEQKIIEEEKKVVINGVNNKTDNRLDDYIKDYNSRTWIYSWNIGSTIANAASKFFN